MARFFLLLTLSCVLLAGNAHAAQLRVSAERYCSGYAGKLDAYRFTKAYGNSALSVYFSSSTLAAKIRLRIVETAGNADLVLEDSDSGADLKVCSARGSGGDKTIRIAPTSGVADLTVYASDSAHNPDYRIYVDSKIFTLQEAMALLLFLELEK